MKSIGIHHVTAIAGRAQRNLDFYRNTLGLRLVKRTVNFDDPGTWHLYFGDEAGSPGSIVTFFPWEHAARGQMGTGEVQETVLRVPLASMGYWLQRLIAADAAPQRGERFGEPVLRFQDPDGMRLALVGLAGIEAEPAWAPADIPAEHAVRGMQGVSLLLADTAPTGAILEDIFGFQAEGAEGSTTRYRAPGVAVGGVVDLAVAAARRGRPGAGTVHHLAFRAADDSEEAAMVARLASNHGIQTTEQRDRNYFRSVYFREPGHVLFEIATDIPGFDADEPRQTMGEALKLPSGLEQYRTRIEQVLPALV